MYSVNTLVAVATASDGGGVVGWGDLHDHQHETNNSAPQHRAFELVAGCMSLLRSELLNCRHLEQFVVLCR